MQHVDGFCEPHGVDRPVGVAVVRLDNPQDAGAEPLPGFGGRLATAELGDTKRIPHVVPDRLGETQEVALRRPDPVQGLLIGRQDTTHTSNIPLWV